MKIYLQNHSTVISNEDVGLMVPAFKRYLSYVASRWGAWGGASLVFGAPPDPNNWQIVILDDSDQAGALGYHDFTPSGKPISKVFAATDKQYGASLSVTLTHELAEMIADPWITRCEQTSNTQAYATEIGDPVEADGLAFDITMSGYPPVLCSDFVLPAWFIPGSPGPYDWRRHCTGPLQVLAGGYAQYMDAGGWHSVNADGVTSVPAERANRFRPRANRHA